MLVNPVDLNWSGRGDSNPRPQPWQGPAWPIRRYPRLSHDPTSCWIFGHFLITPDPTVSPRIRSRHSDCLQTAYILSVLGIVSKIRAGVEWIMSKLTKRAVDALETPKKGQTFLWDGELRGFGVRAIPSGLKTFVLQYRNAEGRSRRIAIGRYGVLTVEQARDK